MSISCSRAPHCRAVFQNREESNPETSPKKQSIMKYSPGLLQDTKSFRSYSGNRAKVSSQKPSWNQMSPLIHQGHQTVMFALWCSIICMHLQVPCWHRDVVLFTPICSFVCTAILFHWTVMFPRLHRDAPSSAPQCSLVCITMFLSCMVMFPRLTSMFPRLHPDVFVFRSLCSLVFTTLFSSAPRCSPFCSVLLTPLHRDVSSFAT